MAARYTVEGPWTQVDTVTVHDGLDTYIVATIESATLVTNRDGRRYPGGARRVVSKLKGQRTKTFRGETAWSDAERYGADIAEAARRQYIDTGELRLR